MLKKKITQSIRNGFLKGSTLMNVRKNRTRSVILAGTIVIATSLALTGMAGTGTTANVPMPVPKTDISSTPTPTASSVATTETVQAAAWTPTLSNCEALSLESAHLSTYAQYTEFKAKSEQCENVGGLNPDGTTFLGPTLSGPDVAVPLTSADTTSNPATPASFKDVRANCEAMLNWSDLYDCVVKVKAQWYIDAVNARAPNTGFDWSDVTKWAFDPKLKNVATINIQVYGTSYTDDQARAIAAELVGEALAAKMEIVRHPAGVLVNTYGNGNDEVHNFNDPRQMVRVSLNPIEYTTTVTDVDGKPMYVETPHLVLQAASGIFIDCLNIWWLLVWVWHCATSVCTPPPPSNCDNPLICTGKDPRYSPPPIPGVTYHSSPGVQFTPGDTSSGGSTGNVSNNSGPGSDPGGTGATGGGGGGGGGGGPAIDPNGGGPTTPVTGTIGEPTVGAP